MHPYLIHVRCFLGHTPAHNSNGNSIGSAVFAGLTIVTDGPTDRHTLSVTIGRIYVHSWPTAMRPNNMRYSTYTSHRERSVSVALIIAFSTGTDVVIIVVLKEAVKHCAC